MKPIRLALLIPVLILLIPFPLHAGGAESFEDALKIIDIALDDDDLAAIESLISPEAGLDVAGTVIPLDEFGTLIHDRSARELEIFTDDCISSRETSFEEFLWDENTGAIIAMSEVTMAHFEIIDRDELYAESLLARWEHGELETAVVSDASGEYNVYILPRLTWRVTFENLDDLWYLTGIAARE